MAEVAGLAFGVVSLASLFDSVINCFERVQVGKEFNESFQRCLLQLEVLQLRLHRWHDAFSKVDSEGLEDDELSLTKRHLSDIQSLFTKEEKLSKHYKPQHAELRSDDIGNTQWLANTLRRLSHRHGGNTLCTREKLRWAIHGKKEFEALVCSISVQVANLEQIIPTHKLEPLLNKMRVEDADNIGTQPEANKKDIQFLQETAMPVDQKFADLIKVRMGHEYVRNIAEGHAQLHQGDMVSSEYRGRFLVGGNSYKENVAKGNARVTQGTSYGYNPFAPLELNSRNA